MHQTEFFVILDHFLPFYPPNNLKHQTFEKIEKTLEDIITLHMCTINGNHLMYGSWDMECDRQIFVILDCFLPSSPPPLPTQKIKFLKIWKQYLEISFYICVPKIMIISFTHVYHKSWSYAILFLRYCA